MRCVSLEEATDLERAGGKAVELSHALALGLRVPPTVVVTREALQRFMAYNQLEPLLTAYHCELAEASPSRADEL